MTVWDFADHHAFAFVTSVMFASWGIAWGLIGLGSALRGGKS